MMQSIHLTSFEFKAGQSTDVVMATHNVPDESNVPSTCTADEEFIVGRNRPVRLDGQHVFVFPARQPICWRQQ